MIDDRLIGEQVGFLLLPDLLISLEEVPSAGSFPQLTQWLTQCTLSITTLQ